MAPRAYGMQDREQPSAKSEVLFGPFKLISSERLLQKSGVTVPLSARAHEILVLLVERAGEVVPKNEIMSRVWQDIRVEEGSLRVHIAALRKALGEGENGTEYLTTVPGQGYCFAAKISAPSRRVGSDSVSSEKSYQLPPQLSRMLGRDLTVHNISSLLRTERFISIVGPGGIGKTTVAVAVGHRMHSEFEGAIHFFDLEPLNDPLLVPGAIALSLGLIVRSNDTLRELVMFLRDKRLLLILDNCEHVIEAAAELAEKIFQEAHTVHILTTSRETLRVEGERVLQLPSLESPPADPSICAAEAMRFPAVQLFVERVAASALGFELDDAEAPIVADICRRLDGIALAIELAAGQVNSYGIRETGALLNDRFRLLWEGRRTALLRHRTLGATLDWSYNLLSEVNRAVLCRLSVFVGSFSLDAARDVVTCDEIPAEEVVTALTSLVAKSLVKADTSNSSTRYRLLDTTRTYILGKPVEEGEANTVARRHAAHYLKLLEHLGQQEHAIYAEKLGNVRAALEWSFLDHRDIDLAVALAAASAKLFLRLSLLAECRRWTEQALAILKDGDRGTRREMDIRASLGFSLMFTSGNSEPARTALLRSLELAEELGDLQSQLRQLESLQIFHEGAGEFRNASECAERVKIAALGLADQVGIGKAHSALGISRHLEGDNLGARMSLELALAQLPESQEINSLYPGFSRNRAQIALARTLWLQGYPEQASSLAKQTVHEATTFDHPITLCLALIWAIPVFFWSGDLSIAELFIADLVSEANRHGFKPFQAAGMGFKGELLVKRGAAEAGITLLQSSLDALRLHRYESQVIALGGALVEGLAARQQFDLATKTIDDTIAMVEMKGAGYIMPDLLRIKAQILASLPEAQGAAAEGILRRSLNLARKQSALALELRSAIGLAVMWSKLGYQSDACELLEPLYGKFTEGFATTDLRAADTLLRSLK